MDARAREVQLELKRLHANQQAEVTVQTILEVAESLGHTPTASLLLALANPYQKKSGELLCPTSVSELAVTLLAGKEAHSILVPWVVSGTFTQPVVAELGCKRICGTHPSAAAIDAARRMPELADAEFKVGGRDGAALPDEEFDIVGGVLPLGYRRRSFEFDNLKLHDEGGYELLLRSAAKLHPRGEGLFVVSAGFFMGARANTVRSNLAAAGLSLDAAFWLPPGTWPSTSISTYLIVVSRKSQTGRMFVADASAEYRDAAIANYRAGKSGKQLEAGTHVVPADFRGLPELIRHRAMTKVLGRLKFPTIPLGDLGTIDRAPFDEPGTTGNDLYVRLSNPTVHTEPPIGKRERHYVRARLDPSKVNAHVVAEFFQTPAGQTILEGHTHGELLRQLTRAAVESLPVLVPPPDVQEELVRVDRQLVTLAQDVDRLRSDLWQRPHALAEVGASVKELNREDTFPDWVETLPFPLASVLWTYHTQTEPLRRYAQLDFFFEALAQFLAVVLLSTIHRDQSLFASEWAAVDATLVRQRMSMERATFGTWLAVYQKLAKSIRKGLGNRESAAQWREVTSCFEPDLRERLTGKELVTVLQRANALRNNWRGHGGIVDAHQAELRIRVYSDHVSTVRSVLGGRWTTNPIARPDVSRFVEGMHQTEAETVMGTRTPFPRAVFDLTQPMEHGRMHIVNPSTGESCLLLPLVQLRAAPPSRADACYFYNRLENDGVKFVSYHYAERPDLVAEDAEAQSFLASLREEPAQTEH